MAKKRAKKLKQPGRLYTRALERVVEDERDKIADALAVLQVLSLAMDAHGIPHDSPWWPSVIDVAIKNIKSAFNGLDSVNVEAKLNSKRPVDTDEDSDDD